MRYIADFIMRGRRQAIGVCLLAILLPMMHWLAAATLSLVVLKRGIGEGAVVLLWAGLPLVLLLASGDPSLAVTLVASLISSLVLAYVLRTSNSWQAVLALACVISASSSLIFEFAAPELMDKLVDTNMRILADIQTGIKEPFLPSVDEVHDLFFGMLAMSQAFSMVIYLIIARYWQSELYNPEGFGKEFQGLRLSQSLCIALVSGFIIALAFDELVRWIFLLSIPLLVAALGLVHWAVKTMKLSAAWLVSFYIMTVFMFQLMAPVLITVALMDSWIDLRKRTRSDREG